MMKLSIMELGDRRLDGDGGIPVAARAIACWRHDPGSPQLCRYSSNFVYGFRQDGVRRFLRTAHESERRRDQIEAEIALLVWLAGEGLAVAEPLPTMSDRLVETVATEFGAFHAVAFNALEGEQHDSDDLDADGFSLWGAALGRLHAATRRYPGAADASRPSWQDELALARGQVPEAEHAIWQEIDAIANLLSDLPISPQTYGLIHFDFELDNLMWDDRDPGMLDFDDNSHHWFAADIAFALRDLFDNGVGLDDPRVQAFLRGYRDLQPLDDAMRSWLPIFSRLSRLTGYARLARSLDLDPGEGYPAWLVDLERRLQAMMHEYSASLA